MSLCGEPRPPLAPVQLVIYRLDRLRELKTIVIIIEMLNFKKSWSRLFFFSEQSQGPVRLARLKCLLYNERTCRVRSSSNDQPTCFSQKGSFLIVPIFFSSFCSFLQNLLPINTSRDGLWASIVFIPPALNSVQPMAGFHFLTSERHFLDPLIAVINPSLIAVEFRLKGDTIARGNQFSSIIIFSLFDSYIYRINLKELFYRYLKTMSPVHCLRKQLRKGVNYT